MRDEGDRIDYSVADYQIFRADGGPSIAGSCGGRVCISGLRTRDAKPAGNRFRMRLKKGKRYGHRTMPHALRHGSAEISVGRCRQCNLEKMRKNVMKVKGIGTARKRFDIPA